MYSLKSKDLLKENSIDSLNEEKVMFAIVNRTRELDITLWTHYLIKSMFL